MTDIENEIVTGLATAISRDVETDYLRQPSSFPFVRFNYIDSYNYTATATSARAGNHDRQMYQLEVYSNKRSGKRTEAWSIANLADAYLRSIGLVKTSLSPIPNFEDSTIYRIVGRYTSVVSLSGEIHAI